MNLPVPIYKDKKLTVSADGSVMFYSLAYNEAYRAKSVGAFTESLHKFVNASAVLEKARKKDVRILDMCFGLGYNCAVTFNYAIKSGITNKVHIVSIEKDPHLLEIVAALPYFWPVDGYAALRKCLKNGRRDNLSMEIHLRDAIEAVYMLTGRFDAIYFDPFSISKNPEMWNVAIFSRLRELLADDGVLVTYACGKQARGNMEAAGLSVEEVRTARGAFHPGTRARKALL